MSQEKLLIVLVTCPTGDAADKLATHVVERRLAACVNIIPGIRSIFRWQGQVSDEKEDLLVIKTTPARLEELRDTVIELHSYSTPEFVVIGADSVAEGYLNWAIGETTPVN